MLENKTHFIEAETSKIQKTVWNNRLIHVFYTQTMRAKVTASLFIVFIPHFTIWINTIRMGEGRGGKRGSHGGMEEQLLSMYFNAEWICIENLCFCFWPLAMSEAGLYGRAHFGVNQNDKYFAVTQNVQQHTANNNIYVNINIWTIFKLYYHYIYYSCQFELLSTHFDQIESIQQC